ncbi:thioredoxin family protein [Methanolobus profundi]|uniref:Thioredoxin 1 n=1 Tax=Methanolobus profundi TaxID=487685 RepID=A0A1I4QY82_9EURY|nr:thioredoxin family protein [Methanolobus profundi]SFM45024.1 thioredoxin 1 [Methanolobus profundi]
MNKLILPAIAVIAVLFVLAGTQGDPAEETEITTAINVQHLNDAIAEGPVLVEIGTDSCPACIAQKPILKDIANDYNGKASVMYINAEETRALAASFNIYSIPDMFVIAEITDEGYIYMGADGQTTTDRNRARFIGLTSKGTLTDVLDAAIEYRE